MTPLMIADPRAPAARAGAHAAARLAAHAGAVAAALLLAVSVSACGSSGPAVDPNFTGPSQTVVAIGLQFQPTTLNLPAGQQVRIVLDNQDAGVSHDVKVFEGDTVYATSAAVVGPGQVQVVFGPLPAGRYQFQCEIHPDMLGTIVIGPSATPAGSPGGS